MLSQITQVLEVKAVANVSPKWKVYRPTEPIHAIFQIGEHGPLYEVDKPPPAESEAILNCGCSRFFPVQPMAGELLFCPFHDDWYKSEPAVVEAKPKGEHLVRCHSCTQTYGPIARGHAYTAAYRHSYGKNGNKNPRHHVSIGKPSSDGIVWVEYHRKDN